MRRLGPSPPAVRGCSAHAWCEYSESVEMAVFVPSAPSEFTRQFTVVNRGALGA